MYFRLRMDRTKHWETIYETKALENVSWYQRIPITAISYLEELQIKKDAAIIDVGGGDSFFVDYLLDNGYENITVLDISEKALQRAQQRIGDKAKQVDWIAADASEFKSEKKYNFWYDRAAFHFLTETKDINSYVSNLEKNLAPNGKVAIGTFSEKGPKKCSGIEIQQYSAKTLENVFKENLRCLSCQEIDHPTPFDTIQNFTFCTFEKN